MSALALFALTLALAPEPLLRDPQAKAAFDAAQEAFEAKDYAEASKQLERAYMLEPELDLLYPWAQAERNLGRCESAIDLYQKFIDGGPNQRMIDAANQNIARCEESLAAEGTAEPVPEPAPQTDDEPPPPRVDPVRDDGPAPAKPVGRDVAGGVLVGLGGAAIITGAVLLGIAGKQAKATADANDNSTYLDMRDHAKTLNGAGIGVLVTGGVLVVAGAVRYGVLARRRKGGEVAMGWNGTGVTLAGRF